MGWCTLITMTLCWAHSQSECGKDMSSHTHTHTHTHTHAHTHAHTWYAQVRGAAPCGHTHAHVHVSVPQTDVCLLISTVCRASLPHARPMTACLRGIDPCVALAWVCAGSLLRVWVGWAFGMRSRLAPGPSTQGWCALWARHATRMCSQLQQLLLSRDRCSS